MTQRAWGNRAFGRSRGTCPLLASILLVSVVACENPQPPVACGAIPQVTVHAGESAMATACFTDANGDVLSFSATSSNTGVATVSIAGTAITVSGVAPGGASVTVTATDAGGLQGQQSFQVMVPNRAPLPRGAIPPVSIFVGQRETFDASFYFAEPDGQTLTYGATSSNPTVATVSVAETTVTVVAAATGTTAVTVTATDPGGLAATQTFQTTVPNRSPTPVGTIPHQTVAVNETVTISLMPYFQDPDGDVLTFAARSSSREVATVTVLGSSISIMAVAAGSTTITITAHDPGGLTATQQAGVTVPGGPGFRDDFNSSASLADWAVTYATAEVSSNGVLELTRTREGYNSNKVGAAKRDVEPDITSWTIEARMGREQISNSAVDLQWFTGHQSFPWVRFGIGTLYGGDTNYSLRVWDEEEEEWQPIEWGNSSAINDGAGEMTTIEISSIDGFLSVVAGDTEIVRLELSELGYSVFRYVREVWLVVQGSARTPGLFDWVQVGGTAVNASFLTAKPPDLNAIDSREFARTTHVAGILSAKFQRLAEPARRRRDR